MTQLHTIIAQEHKKFRFYWIRHKTQQQELKWRTDSFIQPKRPILVSQYTIRSSKPD